MAFQKTSVGIDIGSHAVKVVQLKVTEKGAFIQNALYFDHRELAARGVDPHDQDAVAALLKSQMSEHRIPTHRVAVSISGGDSILRYSKLPPVPAWKLKTIMGFEVDGVAEKVGEALASDYRVMPLPREAGDDQVILVGLAKEPALVDFLGSLESAGIVVEQVIPTPLALCTAYQTFGPKLDPDSPDDDLSILVDLGHTFLNTVLVLNGNIVFARSVSFGGEKFTAAVRDALKVNDERAEELKIRKATVDINEVEHEKMFDMCNALRACAAQLHSLIQSALRYCQTQVGVNLPDPTRLVLVGGGSRLRGLAPYLEEALHLPVESFHPSGVVATGTLDGHAAEIFQNYPGDFSVPIGLAVSGVQEGGFSLNIVPSSYRERRRFRDRTVFLYAAAVFLVINVLFGFSHGFRLNSRVDETNEELRGRESELVALNTEMTGNLAENASTRHSINRLLREVEVGGFQAFCLDYFQSALPAEVKVNRMRMANELDEDETGFEYVLSVEGTVDNANQEGTRILDRFLTRLKGESRVAGADLNSMIPKGTLYEFEMAIMPRFHTQGF